MPPRRKITASVKFPEDFSVVLENQKHCEIDKALLQKVKDGCIAKLTPQESQKLWDALHGNLEIHLRNLFPEEECLAASTEEQSAALKFMDTVLYLLKQIVDAEEPYVDTLVGRMLFLLTGLLKNDCLDEKMKIQICRTSEEWCKKQLVLHTSISVNSLEYLLPVSLRKGALKMDVRRVFSMRQALKLDFNLGKNRSLLLDAMRNVNFLSVKDGCSFLSQVMTLDVQLTKELHDVCKSFLPECKKNFAKAYGEIYYSAWSTASSDMRKMIEEFLIQDFMERILTLRRQGMDMSQLGANVFCILHVFHSHKTYAHVRSMLATLYEPLLWRNLKSHNSIIRSNTAQVFLDAYPLEKPGEGRSKNAQYIAKQHKVMTELLTDDSHIVRIIAARQVCQIASEYWQVIPPDVVQRWLQIVVSQLARDASCPEVRRSVYRGLRSLVINPLCAEYMQQVLPHLQDGIHDNNAMVRTAFAEMLVACKESSPIKFWTVVPLEHLLARLATDDCRVGQILVKLLFDSFYPYEKGPEVTLKRIMNMVVLCPTACRKFFAYSKPVLKFDLCVELMVAILKFLQHYVESNMKGRLTMRNGDEDTASASNGPKMKNEDVLKKEKPPPAKKRRLRSPEGSADSDVADSKPEDNEELYLKTSLENPLVSEIFVDIVAILCTVHSAKIGDENYKEPWNKVFRMCQMCVPLLLRYFKGSRTYDSVICLASMLPQSVMRSINHNSRIDSTCRAQLKALNSDDSDEDILRVMMPLCMWSYGDDVLETAKYWIDEAFRAENLSATRYGKPRAERRRVKIRDIHDPKPLLGFRLLNVMFTHPSICTKILSKHYTQILDLWKYLERVKKLIENRLEEGVSFNNSLLSDSFIKECFSRYLRLIPHLRKDAEEDPFDAITAFKNEMDWSERMLVSNLPREFPLTSNDSNIEWIVIETSGPLMVDLINEVITVAANLISIGESTVKFTYSVIRFCKLVLRTGCRVLFVYTVGGIIASVYEQYKRISRKNLMFLLSTLLYLAGDCAKALTDMAYTKEMLKIHIKNFAQVRTVMINILMSSLRIFGKSHNQLANGVDMFVDSIIGIVNKDSDLLENCLALKKLQDLPFVGSQLLTIFFDSKELSEIFFSRLAKNISGSYLKNPSMLLSAVAILHLSSHCNTKYPTERLKKLITSAKLSVQDCKSQDSRSSCDSMCDENRQRQLNKIQELFDSVETHFCHLARTEKLAVVEEHQVMEAETGDRSPNPVPCSSNGIASDRTFPTPVTKLVTDSEPASENRESPRQAVLSSTPVH